ncbi:hypothetical protein K0M31_012771 [Melipona bicolor]|uniref:Uncharacterized protein n=1 Tax=Melipona bicolor TaxID=60889 RepID=A0AA40KH13_9HYME|nr:hypothetical protein K0M31_012771 [Melipona bicolor]
MKTLAVIFTFCLVGVLALTEEQKAKLSAHKTACIAETGVDQQLIEDAKKGIAADDDKLSCFAFCMLKKIGAMTDDGTINVELVRQKLSDSGIPVEKIDNILNKCTDMDYLPFKADDNDSYLMSL